MESSRLIGSTIPHRAGANEGNFVKKSSTKSAKTSASLKEGVSNAFAFNGMNRFFMIS